MAAQGKERCPGYRQVCALSGAGARHDHLLYGLTPHRLQKVCAERWLTGAQLGRLCDVFIDR